MNNFEKHMNISTNENINSQEKDGGIIYENLSNSPAVLRVENGRAACMIHIGAGREEQQDRVVFGPNGLASIDGMGGEGKFGGVAAQILAEEMRNGFSKNLSPEEIHKNAFSRMQAENIGSSGACYLAFKLDGRTLRSFSAGDVKLGVVKQNGEIKDESIEEKGLDQKGNEVVTNALQGTRPGICRIQTPVELEDGDRIFMGSDGFWNQFPGGITEIAELVKDVSAETAVKRLNQIAMERMMNEKPDTYKDNLNIIVYDFNAFFGKSEPSPFASIERGKTANEDKEERNGIFAHIKRWFEQGKSLFFGENSEDFNWSKVSVDMARRRRILDSFEKKEGTWEHELSYFEKTDPEQAKKEEAFMNKITKGEIGSREISHFLLGIKAPIGEEENPLLPEQIFEDINRCKGEVLSMPALISELAGTPTETLTVESLGQFLLKYPEPTMLQDTIKKVLSVHMEEKDEREFVQWPEFMRATLWMIYGKRAKYAEQITLLYKEAEKKYPEIINKETLNPEKEEQSEQENLRERIIKTTHPHEMEQLYVESMERLFKKLKEELGNIDETILFDERFYRRLESDEVRKLANERYSELSGVGGTYRYNEDLLALAHIMHGPSAEQTILDFSKIKKGPYAVESK